MRAVTHTRISEKWLNLLSFCQQRSKLQNLARTYIIIIKLTAAGRVINLSLASCVSLSNTTWCWQHDIVGLLHVTMSHLSRHYTDWKHFSLLCERTAMASTSANGVGHQRESLSVVSWTGHRFISAGLPILFIQRSRVYLLARRIMRFARKWLISDRRRSA